MANCDLFNKYLDNEELQGTAQILFAEGKFDVCKPADEPTVFCEIGNTSGFTIDQEPDVQFRERFSCGRMTKGAPIVKENGLKASAPVRALHRRNLKLLLRGEDETAVAQSALNAQAVDAMDFTTTPADLDKHYFITDSSTGTKVKIYNVTDVTIDNAGTPLVNGVDYVFRKAIGAIKFLTAQTANLTVTVTASAKTVTPLKVGAGSMTEGWIKILYFPTESSTDDQCEPEVILDGPGYMTFQDSVEINYEGSTEANLTFDFKDTVRVEDLREVAS